MSANGAGPEVNGIAGEDEETWTISNEFAFVTVSRVRVGNGERLRISSSGDQSSVLLDSVVLEVISRASPEDLNALVARDFDR